MNILIITSDFYPNLGGVSVFNQGIAESLALAGHRVYVLTPDLPGMEDGKLPYRVIRYKTTKYLASLWPSVITLYLTLIHKFDLLLYGQAVSTLTAGGILARMLNLTRLAMLTHGNDLDYAVTCNLDKYFLARLISTADIILANSNYTKEKVLTRYPKIATKIKIFNPGVWPDQICREVSYSTNNEIKDKNMILTVARLVPKKGVDDLINAFALVLKKHPEMNLRILGDGPERKKLEAIVCQLKLENNIYFAGAKNANEVYAVMRRCSLFVLPSKIVDGDVETFGIVYLEANACGKAVIGTRQGGVPDAVEDGVTGILVEPGNVKQLAEAMLLLIENKEVCLKMGQAGRARIVSEFDWEKVAKRLELYLK